MTSGFATWREQDFAWFFDLKEDDLWTCIVSVHECAIFPHQPPMDLMGLSGTIKAAVLLDKLLFSSGAASYQWGYESCKPPGSSARASTTLDVNGVTSSFSDEVPDCPTVSKLRFNGTWDLGSDRKVWITMTSPWGGAAYNQSTVYIGHFVMDVNPIDRVTTTTTPLLSASSSTSLTSSTSSATVTSASTSSTGSRTSSASTRLSTSSSGVLSLQSLPDISNSSTVTSGGVTENTLSTGSTDSMQSKLPGIIGGSIAGAFFLIIIIIFFFWKSRQRQKRLVDIPYIDDAQYGDAPWTPYTVPSDTVLNPNGGGIMYAGRKNRPLSPSLPVHSREALVGRVSNPQTPPSEDHTPETRSANNLLHDISGPGYPVSPVTTAGGLPAYETYMNAPLVTFRRGGAPREIVSEDNQFIDDSLHRWAEGHRDFVPPHLESRLRAGGYVPESNPSDISMDSWSTRFGVTRYELAGLQELYGREHSL